MREHTLRRFASTEDGTIGRLDLGLDRSLYVLEEEDKGNQRNESRIPAGRYLCKRTIYNRHGYETFEVTGVPDRSRILFHPGNTEEDSQGCLLPGLELDVLRVPKSEDTGRPDHKLAVLRSQDAFDKMMRSLRGVDEWWLTIVDDYADVG